MSPRVHSLHIYPIKSCAGIDLRKMSLGPRGPLHDREWAIIDSKTNGFLSQRQLPQLTQVKTRLTDDKLMVTIPQKSGALSEAGISLEPSEGEMRTVKIWNDECLGIESTHEASEALSDFLSYNVKLVRMARDFERKINPKYGHPDAQTSFGDQFPFLLTTLSSLKDLNSRLENPVPIDRFRPNIVIDGTLPFVEDSWKEIVIGNNRFAVVKPCKRCVIINTDQATGARSPETLKALAGFRNEAPNLVSFGQYLIHRTQSDLRAGDELFDDRGGN